MVTGYLPLIVGQFYFTYLFTSFHVQDAAWPGTWLSVSSMLASSWHKLPIAEFRAHVLCRRPELIGVMGHLLLSVLTSETCCQGHCIWRTIIRALIICWSHIWLTHRGSTAELTTANGGTFTSNSARLGSQSRYGSLDQWSTCFNVIGYWDWLSSK